MHGNDVPGRRSQSNQLQSDSLQWDTIIQPTLQWIHWTEMNSDEYMRNHDPERMELTN